MRTSGYKFLEALEHFSDPAEFECVRASITLAQFHANGADRERRLSELTAPLARILFDRLSSRELLASAMSFSLSSRDHTVILPEETFKLPGLRYSWGWNTLEAPGFVFRNVEFFTPLDPPFLLAGKVAEFTGQYQAARANPIIGNAPLPSSNQFSHDQTYEHVSLGKRDFSFSKLQSTVVEKLHRAAKSGQPWVHGDDLRDQIGFDTAHLSGLFRRQKHWRELIASDGRGYYSLRIEVL